MSEEPTPIPFTNVSPCDAPRSSIFCSVRRRYGRGKKEGEYYDISDMIQDLVPRSYIEQLFVIDLVDATFEIFSLRRVKVALKAMSYGEAMEALLRRALLCDAPPAAEKLLRIEAKLEAKKWREKPESRPAIEARLTKMGIDDDAILAEMFAQSRTALEALDKRLALAQQRRNSLLREVWIHREFARRARAVSDKVIENVSRLAPKQE